MKSTLKVLLAISMLVSFSCSTKTCSPEELKEKNFSTQVDQLKKQVQNMKTIKVYKQDGSIQCEADSGQSVEKMALELKDIKIYSSEKKHDGLMRTQVCGQITGQCNVYEIADTDLDKATQAGFKLWKGK